MLYLTSFIFLFLLYFLPLRFYLEKKVLFPVLGARVSFLILALFIYLLIFLILGIIKQFYEFLFPSFPLWSREISRRTGIFSFEFWAFRFSLLAFLFFLVVDTSLIPLSLAAALAFGYLLTIPIPLRPVGSSREVHIAPFPAQRDTPEFSDAERAGKFAEGEKVEQVFEWEFSPSFGSTFSGRMQVALNKRRYEEYAYNNPFRKGTPLSHNYNLFITRGITDEVAQVASNFLAISQEQGFSTFQEISNILAFVQAIPFKSDQETKGKKYLRFPLETLYEKKGDADCKAILFAAILKCIGYEVLVLEGSQTIAIAVAGAQGVPGRFFDYQGRRYYYCETSSTGWKIGEIPPDLSEDQFKVYAV